MRSDKIIAPNYGTEWKDVVQEDGTIKDEAIYIRDEHNGTVALSVEDIDDLIEARDAILAAQREVELNKMPTEPGLYVALGTAHLDSAVVLRLHPGRMWDKITKSAILPLSEEDVRELKRNWGGLIPLTKATED